MLKTISTLYNHVASALISYSFPKITTEKIPASFSLLDIPIYTYLKASKGLYKSNHTVFAEY
jgi:hypothetical protein